MASPGRARIGPYESLRIGFSPVLDARVVRLRSLLVAAVAVLVVMFLASTGGANRPGGHRAAHPGRRAGAADRRGGPYPTLILAITILLIPVSFIGLVLLLAAGLFGWIAIGLEVGKRLAEAFKWELQPPAAAGWAPWCSPW